MGMIIYQLIPSSNFISTSKNSVSSPHSLGVLCLPFTLPWSLISTWPAGEVLQLSPARKHCFANSRISLSSVLVLLCRAWLLGEKKRKLGFWKRKFLSHSDIPIKCQGNLSNLGVLFFGCGVYCCICFWRSKNDELWPWSPYEIDSRHRESEVSADGRLLEGAKTLCKAGFRDGDAITVVAQGVSWL